MAVVDGFYEATFILKNTVSPRVATTALGFLFTDVDQPTPSEAADDLKTIVVGSGKLFAAGSMIDDWIFLGVHVAQGTPTGDLLGEANTSVTGTVVDSSPPSNCSVLVSKQTALGGRKYRGRMFLPPCHLNEGAVDAAGNILTSPLGVIQGYINTTLGALVVANWQPVLFHQGTSPPDPTPITALTAQSLIATQRRRMRS